jgi:hypothetical protein
LFGGGGGVMSYLRNLSLFQYGGVQHLLCYTQYTIVKYLVLFYLAIFLITIK